MTLKKIYIQLRLRLYKLFIWLFLLFPPYRHATPCLPSPQIIHFDNFPSFSHGKLCEFGTTLICLFSCLHHTSWCGCKNVFSHFSVDRYFMCYPFCPKWIILQWISSENVPSEWNILFLWHRFLGVEILD